MEQFERIFYTICGPHTSENGVEPEMPEQIIKRKMEEIREEGDISLWSARIGEWDLKRVWGLELPEGKTLYALCSIGGKGSKEPGKKRGMY